MGVNVYLNGPGFYESTHGWDSERHMGDDAIMRYIQAEGNPFLFEENTLYRPYNFNRWREVIIANCPSEANRERWLRGMKLLEENAEWGFRGVW